MSESLKTAKVIPTSRSVAANAGQSTVGLPAVPALQLRTETQLQNEPIISRTQPAPFQLKASNAELQPAAQMKENSTAVIQAVFNRASVEDAIMGANKGMRDMGGTTGGAFHLVTNAQDQDVKELVLKASGKRSAVIASDIYNMIGIPAPRSLMLPTSQPLLNHLGRLYMGAAAKFGEQASIEVQQHTNTLTLPDSVSRKSSPERAAAILAGDTLTGNHDRIHRKNAGNISKGFAIDNAIKDDTIESKAMMKAAGEIIQRSSDIHGQIRKIYGLTGFERNGSLGRVETLELQKTFLSGLQHIGGMSEEILAFIRETNQQEDEHSQSLVERLKIMSESDDPIPGETLEGIIAGLITQKSTRMDLIIGSIKSTGKDIGTNRYPELVTRLAQITKWHDDGDIAQALEMINEKIEKISGKYAAKKEKWDTARSIAEGAANQQWDNQSILTRIIANKEAFIRDILRGWEVSNPQPQ